MKDYNFMISDNRLHKTRFCKKRGEANQNFPHKEGGLSEREGGLNDFVFWGRLVKKMEVTFLRGGRGSYPGSHYEMFFLFCHKQCLKQLVTRFLT